MKHRKSKPTSTSTNHDSKRLPKRARPVKAALPDAGEPPLAINRPAWTPPSPYLTADEAAKYLKVFHTGAALWQATKRYGIPHIRLGKHILYVATQLDEFMSVATEATGTFRRRR